MIHGFYSPRLSPDDYPCLRGIRGLVSSNPLLRHLCQGLKNLPFCDSLKKQNPSTGLMLLFIKRKMVKTTYILSDEVVYYTW